jgi:hypothetical protein
VPVVKNPSDLLDIDPINITLELVKRGVGDTLRPLAWFARMLRKKISTDQ